MNLLDLGLGLGLGLRLGLGGRVRIRIRIRIRVSVRVRARVSVRVKTLIFHCIVRNRICLHVKESGQEICALKSLTCLVNDVSKIRTSKSSKFIL